MTIADINEQPRGCATDGKSHLNLTRSLADVWGRPTPAPVFDRPPLPAARPMPIAPTLRRFAGYDPTERQVKKITQGYPS
jgi:hypothetical protein